LFFCLTKPIKILLSALDWGNGHAARSVQIATTLQGIGVHVDIACTAAQQVFFSKELSDVRYFNIDGYNIQYPNGGGNFAMHLLLQLPKVLHAIKKEHDWLAQHCLNNHYDCIISDNRYGFYHTQIHCIIICHQSNLQTPVLQKIANKWHHKLLEKFNERWIPDGSAPNNFAGKLSIAPITLKHSFIGTLSRLEKIHLDIKPNTVFVILSGPREAQEQLHHYLVQQHHALKNYEVIIAGNSFELPKHYAFNYAGMLNKTELAVQIATAEIVISRSGYSTIMDLAKLQKHAILIATKGQTEQEYLAEYMHQQNWHTGLQNFPSDLVEILETHKGHTFSNFPEIDNAALNNKATELLHLLMSK
jgi:uncharacterized protein (TIGR00661 family)